MLELITLDPEFYRVFNLLSTHRAMIADDVRVSAFARAISSVVKEGDVVVDLGTGTGILAFLAVKAGARRVYAIECTDMIKVAQEVAEANGLADRITFCHTEAKNVELPEKADVVISETIGHMGIAECFLENMADARTRFLKSGGKLIPESIEIFAAPVECEEAYEHVAFWNQEHYGVDYSPALHNASNKVYIHTFHPSNILAQPVEVADISLYCVKSSSITRTMVFKTERAGTMHGLCGWFTARLAGELTLSTSPCAVPTHWGQAFLPLPLALPVLRDFDMQFGIDLACASTGPCWSWERQNADTGQSPTNVGSP